MQVATVEISAQGKEWEIGGNALANTRAAQTMISRAYRTHPAEPSLPGSLMHPIERVGNVLRFVRAFTRNPALPDTLTVMTAILTGPEGQPVCAIIPSYTGSQETSEKWLAPLRQFGSPLRDTLPLAPYSERLNVFADHKRAGTRSSYSSQRVPALTDAAIDTIAAFAQSITSPETTIVLHHVHGAVRRTPTQATASPTRDIPYFLGIFVGWQPGGDALRHCHWQARFRAALAIEHDAVEYSQGN